MDSFYSWSLVREERGELVITPLIKEQRNPRITVLMSVYNAEHYLRESIESVLKQIFTDFEFLIINDASCDSSREIILSYDDSRIRLIENPENIGLTQSLNKGLKLARGEYVARQDADDKSHPSRFQRQLNLMDEYPDLVVIGTQCRYIDENGKLLKLSGWSRLSSEVGIRWICMFESPFIHSSVMFRTSIVRDKYNGYNPEYKTSQDHELWSRIVYNDACHNINEELIDFRIHSKSVSSNYVIDQMSNVAKTLSKSASEGLKMQPVDGWVEQWIKINNFSLYSNNLDISNIVKIIDQMHERFVKINEVTNEDNGILQHKYYMLFRVAYNAIVLDKSASFNLFLRICRDDIVLAVIFIPKYLMAFLLGKEKIKIMAGFRKMFANERKI